MMTRLSPLGVLTTISLALATHAHALESKAGRLASPIINGSANVVLLMLDGVRWEEVFHGIDDGLSVDTNTRIFEFLTGPFSKQGFLVGDRKRGETVRVANKHQNSLPGYQSIMAGATQPCASNLCGRIRVETFQERLVQDLRLERNEVATISSWEKIAYAVEHVENTTFVNAGNRPLLVDGSAMTADEAKINHLQDDDTPPWGSARWDKYTFAHGVTYLKTQKPRFLFISLNDSDEWGHRGDYEQYVKTLRQHDAWIKELVDTLDSMGEYGRNTTLLISTDHGRGDGNGWDDHGAGIADSGNVWLFGRSPYTTAVAAAPTGTATQRTPSSEAKYSHLDLRPTIEASFGLEPKLDGLTPPPGRAIMAIIGDPRVITSPQRKIKKSLASSRAKPQKHGTIQ